LLGVVSSCLNAKGFDLSFETPGKFLGLDLSFETPGKGLASSPTAFLGRVDSG
jgi:hypothetical protein